MNPEPGDIPDNDPAFDVIGTGDEWEPQSLVELVNRVLDRGVVISGDITLSVAGVDLVYLNLNAVLTSVSTARRQLGKQVGAGGEQTGEGGTAERPD